MSLPESTGPSDREVLIKQIGTLAVVRGRVTLSSGQEADYYVDLRRVTLDGATAPVIGRVMRALVADWDFDAVGGLTLGADPVATAMLHAAAGAGTGWTPSWSARRRRPTDCSAASKVRRSRDAGCWSSRTPAPPGRPPSPP